jgi:hypothetical protein
LDYVQGLAEDEVEAQVLSAASNDTAIVVASVGIGVDSTTVNSASLTGQNALAVSNNLTVVAFYKGYPGIGRHALVWLEQSAAGGGITTWVSSSQSGMIGVVLG